MVFSHRLWYILPNRMDQFHQAFQRAKALTEKHGGTLLGAWQTSIGRSNEVTTIFAYNDPGHRAQTLEARANDPEWPDVINSIWAVLERWETRAVVAAPGYPPFEANTASGTSPRVFLHRIWHIAPGKMTEFHQVLREAMTLYTGMEPVGVWQTSIGRSNEVITIAGCGSLAEMEKTLAQRAQDAAWPPIYKKIWGVVERWDSWIARGTPYSAIR